MPLTSRPNPGSLEFPPPPQRMDLAELCAPSRDSTCASYCRWKQLIDRSLALLLLIPALPLMGILVLLVRATSRGPGIYRQVRVGRHGKLFTMYKIRTMRPDAEVGTGAVWTQSNDPRITRLGAVLRKVHLDELPQLLNVLKGEMSLVGPRPERPEFVYILAKQIAGYTERLAVLPGVTGLSQINLPPDSDLNSVRRKQILDLEYIRTAGFWLDLRMMLCTSLRLIGIGGTLATRLAFVRRPIPSLHDEPPQAGQIERRDGAEAAGVTPTTLTSSALRETLTQLTDTLSDEQEFLREQIEVVMPAEPSGNGHGKRPHFGDNSHDSSSGSKRSGEERLTKELRIGRPR